MEKLKSYLVQNFEQVFVLMLLLTTALLNHFLDQRLAFLNFFFLPVILAAYYLGVRKAILGAVLTSLLVLAYVILDPSRFQAQYDDLDLYLHLAVWAGFLLLSGAIVGSQKENLERSLQQMRTLNSSLEQNQKDLNQANESLKAYSENLEAMVQGRTEELEASKAATQKLKEKVESALYSTIDSSVAKLIIEGRIRSDKRQISVMFADLVSFTTYSEERSPELVVRDVNNFLAKMEPILSGFHGHLDKFLGDGIMCQFGAPINFEHYRLMAVLTALKMQEAIKTEEFPWEMRIGIGSGAAVTGLIGSNRQSYTSIGDVVNLAARLEKACPPAGVVIDEMTYQGCGDFFEVEPFQVTPVSSEEAAIRATINSLALRVNGEEAKPAKAALYMEIAALHSSLTESEEARECYERAIQCDPDNQQAKIHLAEMVIAQQNQGQLHVKGRKKAVKAYAVLRLKDPLDDYNRIPKDVGMKFRPAVFTIPVPESITLKVEALDGSIGHAKIVALLSYAIATRLSIFDKVNAEIMLAGYTADLGKEIIPHHILNSKGVITSSEMEEIQKHPLESVRILQRLGYNSPGILEIVANSHERMDGSGYPRGIKGSDIPLGSRIVAVADAYSAMTSWRPYREKLEQAAALQILRAEAHLQKFDALVVNALVDLLDEDSFTPADFRPPVHLG